MQRGGEAAWRGETILMRKDSAIWAFLFLRAVKQAHLTRLQFPLFPSLSLAMMIMMMIFLFVGVVVGDDDDERDVFALDPVPIIFLVIDDMTMIRINSATKLQESHPKSRIMFPGE